MFVLHIDPAAEEDITEAAEWYALQSQSAARQFLDEIYQVIDILFEYPLIYPKQGKTLHKATVLRFPFCIFYYILAERIIVVACLHNSRDMNTILKARA
ncbi:MAG TPA: type II toxin-antitoxin system RelE/ParE family toxin [Candidatus Kapabacteria bacterium]|nr:type II toxin-antitoxin system RelE/ParE family toxin [Candidatus Kapabacteria bacterium]